MDYQGTIWHFAETLSFAIQRITNKSYYNNQNTVYEINKFKH